MSRMSFAAASILLLNIIGCSRQTTQQADLSRTRQVSNDIPAVRVCSTQWPVNRISPVKTELRQSKQFTINQGSSLVGKLYSEIVAAQNVQMAVIRRFEWRVDNDQRKPVRHELKVAFLNGDPAIQDRIMKTARQWSSFIDMTLTPSTVADSDIRISISDDGFSWSLLGNEAVGHTGETMHYGWLFRDTQPIEYERTVLHEFGHALGALHEHQSPAGQIRWKRQVVLDWCHSNNPPWSDEMCEVNIFHRYLPEEAEFTRLDDSSLMAYSFPSTWTDDGFSMPMNWHLSNDDKALMSRIYGTAKH